MGTGPERAPATSVMRLAAQQVNATVALDLYMDPDKTKAGQASEAAFEMIVYFAKIGLEDPVGFGNGTIIKTQRLDGTDL